MNMTLQNAKDNDDKRIASIPKRMVNLGVDYNFDRDYWQWYKAPGRTWTMGVDFTF